MKSTKIKLIKKAFEFKDYKLKKETIILIDKATTEKELRNVWIPLMEQDKKLLTTYELKQQVYERLHYQLGIN